MHIDRCDAGHLEEPAGQNLTVGRYDNIIRYQVLQKPTVFFISDFCGLMDGNSCLLGNLFDGWRLGSLPATGGSVWLCNHGTDLVPACKQCPQRGDGKLRRAQEYDAHDLPFAGFGKFLDLVLDQVSLQNTQAVDEEDSVEVVNLMAEAACQ
jgi:hypothetical protein